MINIKRFVDRVSSLDNRPGRDLVIPVQEARALRDEIVKILADKLTERSTQDVIQVDVSGGKFK
jgi:hypothetical protein